MENSKFRNCQLLDIMSIVICCVDVSKNHEQLALQSYGNLYKITSKCSQGSRQILYETEMSSGKMSKTYILPNISN